MKILALLALGVLLTGCAAADNSVPLASPSQAQSLEIESQTDTQEITQSEPTPEEEETAEVELESAVRESTSPAPAQTQSAKPTAAPAPKASQSAEPTATDSPEPAPEPAYTMSNIAKNNSSTSCWAAISGKAYDLTAWISRHPGGSGAISGICGRDATSVFQGKHGGQSGPASALAPYLLGDVTE